MVFVLSMCLVCALLDVAAEAIIRFNNNVSTRESRRNQMLRERFPLLYH